MMLKYQDDAEHLCTLIAGTMLDFHSFRQGNDVKLDVCAAEEMV